MGKPDYSHAVLYKARRQAVVEVQTLEETLETPGLPEVLVDIYQFKLELARQYLDYIEGVIRSGGGPR